MQQNNMSADGIMISESTPHYLGFKLASYQRASADNADFLQILCNFLYSEWGALGGLRTKPHHTASPNGNWWIAKKYAQMNEDATMLNTDPYYDKSPDGINFGGIEVYATQDNNNILKILLGMYNTSNHDHTGLTRINLENFIPDSYQANYSLYKIKGILHEEVNTPQPLTGTIPTGSPYLDIDWQEPEDSYFVEITLPTLPLDVTISGPTIVGQNTDPTWTAEPSGGNTPYSYFWSSERMENGQWVPGTMIGSQKTVGNFYPYDTGEIRIKVTVTDANGNTTDATLKVDYVPY